MIPNPKKLCVFAFLSAFAFSFSTVHAQVPQEAKSVEDFNKIFWRNTPTGRVPEAACSGKEANPLEGSKIDVKGLRLEMLRDGKNTEFIAVAPQCLIDVKEEYATSAGMLQGFTPTTNFFIQGIGFLCTKTNSLLLISNQVETRIEKSSIKSPSLGGRTNTAGEVVKIFSDQFRFRYLSNIAEHIEHVRVLDAGMTLTCELLTTKFGTNNSIENIVAERNVIITDTNGNRASGDRAVYTVVGTNEVLDLIGNSHWNDGQRDAVAESFHYDGGTDVLTAKDNVRIRYANNPKRPARSADDVSEVTARAASISNARHKYRTVKDLSADGSVIMTNHFDHSYASGEHAVYSDTNSVLQMTGEPLFKNNEGQVAGAVLSIDRTNNIFHSRGNTHALFISRDKKSTQTIGVTCNDLDYTTNAATFTGDVHCALTNGNVHTGDLFANNLVLRLAASNQIVKVIARDNVRTEELYPNGRMDTLWCDVLTLNRNPATQLWRDAHAEGLCRFEQTNCAPKIKGRTLTATNLFAEFSPATNKIERLTAEGDIVALQFAAATNEVRGTKLVYDAEPGENVEVTGHPWARTDRMIISNADRFTWMMKGNKFRAIGPYNIVPVSHTNSVSSR